MPSDEQVSQDDHKALMAAVSGGLSAYYTPVKMVLGLLVGMALAGAVTVIEESLNLLRSIVVSNAIVIADGALLVVPGVAKLLASRFMLNFISMR